MTSDSGSQDPQAPQAETYRAAVAFVERFGIQQLIKQQTRRPRRIVVDSKTFDQYFPYVEVRRTGESGLRMFGLTVWRTRSIGLPDVQVLIDTSRAPLAEEIEAAMQDYTRDPETHRVESLIQRPFSEFLSRLTQQPSKLTDATNRRYDLPPMETSDLDGNKLDDAEDFYLEEE